MSRTVALAGVLLAAGTPALANGRFPASTSVGFREHDGQRLIVGTTFGVILSSDGGKTWFWECEKSVGYGGTFDPTFAASAAGTMFAGTFDGLSITRDGGCTWAYAGGPLDGQWVSDLAIAGDDAVWVATASGATANDIYVSRDDGMSFSHTNVPLPKGFLRRIRIAPSDPRRVYASGYHLDPEADSGTGYASLFFRSDDAGQTWTSPPVTAWPGLTLIYVSPIDPSLLFADLVLGEEKLLRSTDGGTTWDVVLSAMGRVSVVVSRADGVHYLASNNSDGAVWSSDDAGRTWILLPRSATAPACASLRADGQIFACGTNWMPDYFALGKSDDGLTWTKVFRFNELAGPLACPSGTVQKDFCEPQWGVLAQQFGIQPDAAPPAAPDATPAQPGPGGGKCGCGISIALAGVVCFRPRRRRSA